MNFIFYAPYSLQDGQNECEEIDVYWRVLKTERRPKADSCQVVVPKWKKNNNNDHFGIHSDEKSKTAL